MSQVAAGKFLDKLDTHKQVRADVMDALGQIVKVGAKHGHKFTSEELNKAMIKKWGPPKNREKHDEPFTCCFSEAPGR